jgi:predicted nucleic acid-binding protein
MQKKVYIETSIVSYLTARPSRDLVIAARQEITHELWQVLQKQYEIYISALVIQEASRGDENAAKKRLNLLANIPVLEISPDAQTLANGSSQIVQFHPIMRKMRSISPPQAPVEWMFY